MSRLKHTPDLICISICVSASRRRTFEKKQAPSDSSLRKEIRFEVVVAVVIANQRRLASDAE